MQIRICKRCKSDFEANGRQIYCGGQRQEGTCSWEVKKANNKKRMAKYQQRDRKVKKYQPSQDYKNPGQLSRNKVNSRANIKKTPGIKYHDCWIVGCDY